MSIEGHPEDGQNFVAGNEDTSYEAYEDTPAEARGAEDPDQADTDQDIVGMGRHSVFGPDSNGNIY